VIQQTELPFKRGNERPVVLATFLQFDKRLDGEAVRSHHPKKVFHCE